MKGKGEGKGDAETFLQDIYYGSDHDHLWWLDLCCLVKKGCGGSSPQKKRPNWSLRGKKLVKLCNFYYSLTTIILKKSCKEKRFSGSNSMMMH
jgi:hypothetical protein